MCGIFGLVIKGNTLSGANARKLVNDLFCLSESRGKESAGLAVLMPDAISIYKQSVAASTMIRSRDYRAFANKMLAANAHPNQPLVVIGHSRLVTNGSQENHDNNQPVVKKGVVGIHNGIIVNDQELWSRFPSLQREYQVDTEVAWGLMRYFYEQTGSLVQASRQMFAQIEGTASIAALFHDLDALLLATNNGSLYISANTKDGIYLFASEAYILRRLFERPRWRRAFATPDIRQIEPGAGYVIDVQNLVGERFSLRDNTGLVSVSISSGAARPIVDATPEAKRVARGTLFAMPTVIPRSVYTRLAIDTAPIEALRRCVRCVLPETMPFIEFDEQGVCNYCRNDQPHTLLGQDALHALAERHRRQDGRPDCIVTFSGGRDSSYGLHYAKNVLKLHPIAYTYDWGMITDLARRNQARLCGKLGVEHILISADIARKRRYIRKNVLAWLKRPRLGTVPLFMAGDKQYFYYANKLRRQLGVQFVLFGENLMETTRFKSGFCGIRPSFNTEHTYTLSLFDKVKLSLYYGMQYAMNPAYINRSLWDTLGAFASYYVIPHDNVNLYDYIMWEENTIVATLRSAYDWEVAPDTQNTWRIGDGTAAFYNYIYYCVAGFSENDTFRSNQIRRGMISREAALARVYEENQPRFESIQWYCETIGIDMVDTLTRINRIPKLYAAG